MPTIDKLSKVNSLEPSDLLPIWDSANNDTRALPVDVLTDYVDGLVVDGLDGKANASAVGIAGTDVNMGAYSGTTIPDNQTAKQNIQSLETAVEARVITADLASTATGKGAALIGFKQSGTGAVARTALEKMRETLSVLDFGADNTGATDSTAAIQAALDAAAADPLAIKPVYIPAGIYKVSRLVLPRGTNLYGAGGKSVTTAVSNTRLVQNAAGDIFVFDAPLIDARRFWFGRVSDLQIIGSNAFATGYGFNSITASGSPENILFQDQTLFENMTIRAMPQGGMNFTSGALPMTIRNCEFLWNGGPGITCTRLSQFQGVHFADLSADGNVGGAIRFANMSVNDNFLITNLKSEARVNPSYPVGSTGLGQQLNPIVVSNGGGCAITIVGANHISSIPDGANFVKPGSLVQITGTSPAVTWNGVSIRVRVGDTGADPLIIGGVASVYQPLYTVKNGIFNTEFPFFQSRAIFQRETVTGATPSALNKNIMLVDNAVATTITDITDPVDGQVLFMAFSNSNTTVQHGASTILLNNGADWTPTGNSTLTLGYIGGRWRELARSYGGATGVYTVTNVTTDRVYDAAAATVGELANVLGTLLGDLKVRGVI